jgi:hypothetical protein
MRTWKEYLTEANGLDLNKHLEVSNKILKMFDNGSRTAKLNGKNIEIYNNKNKIIAIIEFKGKRYTINSASGSKIISGSGAFAKALSDLLKDYWYAELTDK